MSYCRKCRSVPCSCDELDLVDPDYWPKVFSYVESFPEPLDDGALPDAILDCVS